MQHIHIIFLTEEDRVNGFYELIKNARVTSFPGKVYQVPIQALKLLQDKNISYRQASDDEVKTAHDQVRNTSSVA